jgi:hypothetical protein
MYTALLTAIVSWISVNFDPPPNFQTGASRGNHVFTL